MYANQSNCKHTVVSCTVKQALEITLPVLKKNNWQCSDILSGAMRERSQPLSVATSHLTSIVFQFTRQCNCFLCTSHKFCFLIVLLQTCWFSCATIWLNHSYTSYFLIMNLYWKLGALCTAFSLFEFWWFNICSFRFIQPIKSYVYSFLA